MVMTVLIEIIDDGYEIYQISIRCIMVSHSNYIIINAFSMLVESWDQYKSCKTSTMIIESVMWFAWAKPLEYTHTHTHVCMHVII